MGSQKVLVMSSNLCSNDNSSAPRRLLVTSNSLQPIFKVERINFKSSLNTSSKSRGSGMAMGTGNGNTHSSNSNSQLAPESSQTPSKSSERIV